MTKSQREAIEARLERIASLHRGRLTPDAVVQDARSPKSPLHDQFTWDDTEAANQWRLNQARELIRSVHIEVRTESRVLSTVRYVRDPAAGTEQGYVEVAKLRTKRDLAREALLTELRAAQALFARARSLAEALGLADEFEQLSDRTEVIVRKVQELESARAVSQ